MNSYLPAKSPWDTWLTVKLLAQAEPSFTEAAIRNHVFNAAPRQTSTSIITGNGLAPHIRRVGSKVLINHGGFLSWIEGDGDRIDSLSDEPVQKGSIRSGKHPERAPTAPEAKEAGSKRAASKAGSFASPFQKIDFKPNSKQGGRRQL